MSRTDAHTPYRVRVARREVSVVPVHRCDGRKLAVSSIWELGASVLNTERKLRIDKLWSGPTSAPKGVIKRTCFTATCIPLASAV